MLLTGYHAATSENADIYSQTMRFSGFEISDPQQNLGLRQRRICREQEFGIDVRKRSSYIDLRPDDGKNVIKYYI